jgi:hypothetical protein
MHLLPSPPLPPSIAAWVIAGGAALGYNYYRTKQDNGAKVSAAEIESFNATRKSKLDKEGKGASTTTGTS